MLAVFFLWAVQPPVVYAQNVPPGANADVLEQKARKEAEKELVKPKPAASPSVEMQKPVGAKQPEIRFVLREVKLQGDIVLPQETLKPAVERYLNREVGLDDLKRVTDALEQEYRNRGYFAVVFIPPQKIQDGKVLLQVVNSHMGQLKVEGNRYFRPWRTKSYWRVPEDAILRLDKINSSIMAMNDNPDRRVRPLLRAGEKPRTTDIILKTDEHFPLHAGFSFDNQGVKSTGKLRPGFSVRNNNLLGLDDIFLIGTAFGSAFGALYINHLIPVSPWGTRFIWGYSHSQVTPGKALTDQGINGLSDTYSMSIRQKIFRNYRASADFFIGLDIKEKRTKALSVTSVWDRLRVFSTGFDMQAIDAHGLWIFGAAIYLGVSPFGDSHVLTSRQAESNFAKYGLNFERQQKLFWNTLGIVRSEVQLTPDKLTPQEELFLGGTQSVRGYPESDYGADQGFFVQVEHWTPFFFVPEDWHLPYDKIPFRDQAHIILFADYGYGKLYGPAPEEGGAQTLLGTGVGLDLRFTQHVSGRVEWAAALADEALTEGGRSQFHFRLRAEV